VIKELTREACHRWSAIAAKECHCSRAAHRRIDAKETGCVLTPSTLPDWTPSPPRCPYRCPCYTLSVKTPPAAAPRSAHSAWCPRSVRAVGRCGHGPHRPPSARGQAATHRPTRRCGLPRDTNHHPWQVEPVGWNRPSTIHIFSFSWFHLFV
jgi:hypothetical protein